jgi:hypothetical protein
MPDPMHNPMTQEEWHDFCSMTLHGAPPWETLRRIYSTIDARDLELERYKQWVSDLQSGMFINCVYCGHRYGPADEVPATMADALKEHIEQCPEHPMSKTHAEAERLRRLVWGAVHNAGRVSPRWRPRWAHIADALGVGSTTAQKLCAEFELDPDEEISEVLADVEEEQP